MMARKTDLIQQRAMEIVEIRPMSDAANNLINAAIEEHGFDNRVDAFTFLQQTGALEGVDIGGEILNDAEARATLVKEFSCHKDTARNHVARAARRKRHPDWKPPQWGGKRPGAGRPFDHVIDVANGRAFVSRRVDGQFGLLQYSAAANWKELEDAAVASIVEQGGGINLSGQYPCPPELAAQAVWVWSEGERGDEDTW